MKCDRVKWSVYVHTCKHNPAISCMKCVFLDQPQSGFRYDINDEPEDLNNRPYLCPFFGLYVSFQTVSASSFFTAFCSDTT